jgi:hypothetical protein
LNLANEISSLEAEIESLREENEILQHNKSILEFENDSLRGQLGKISAERDNEMRRSERLKSLIDQNVASLMLGVKRYNETEREHQELRIAQETKDLPRFLVAARLGNGHDEKASEE